MSDERILLLLNLLIWGFFLAAAGARLPAAPTRRPPGAAGLERFTCCATWSVLLDLSAVERAVNTLLGGLPVVLYLRSGLLLLTAQLFARMFQAADPQPRRWIEPLLSATTGIILLLLFLFIPAQWARLPVEQQIVVVRTLRDGLMCAWIGLFFFPLGLELWQREQVRLMKVRDLLTLGFYGGYMIYGSLSLLHGLLTDFAPRYAADVMAGQRSIGYLCLLLFFLLLLPFRGLRVLLYPRQLYLYWRLRRLGQAVLRQSSTRFSSAPLRVPWFHSRELELATYQNLIVVLDHYRGIGAADPVVEQIEAIVLTTPQYPDLVRRLAAVRL